MKKINFLLLVFIVLSSCNGFRVDRLLEKSSPYDTYVKDLNSASFHDHLLIKSWKEAGAKAFSATHFVSLPYQELGHFSHETPSAFFVRFSALEGQIIHVKLERISEPSTLYFIDFFEVKEESQFKRLSSANDFPMLEQKIKKSGVYAVRIQPEVLGGGIYNLSISYGGSLVFPIPDKTSANISSFYGDPRDGGRRKHEGVDVFATKGTPVVAVTDGRVSRVGTNRLGGKTVSVAKDNYSYYYAHLDSQLVDFGQQVRKGDTLGLVGNTGNAITTAPHLHFGIYGAGWKSVDPLPFFKNAPKTPPISLADSVNLGRYYRVKSSVANLRQAPSTNAEVQFKLSKHDLLFVEGKLPQWLRVQLPNHSVGYIAMELIEPISSPIRNVTLGHEDYFKAAWQGNLYQSEYEQGNAQVYGNFENFQWIKTAKNRWIWHLVEASPKRTGE